MKGRLTRSRVGPVAASPVRVKRRQDERHTELSGVAGAVLAGGESRRMGRDKALLRVGGETLVRRQLRVLREFGVDPLFVVRRPGQSVAVRLRGARVIRDEFLGAGPLGGLQAALKEAEVNGARWVAVLAVDMPGMDRAWFRRLWRECRPGVGAVGRGERGYEPIAAIYPCEALRTVVRRLGRGKWAMQDCVRQLVRSGMLVVIDVPEAERRKLENWNEPTRAPRVSYRLDS